MGAVGLYTVHDLLMLRYIGPISELLHIEGFSRRRNLRNCPTAYTVDRYSSMNLSGVLENRIKTSKAFHRTQISLPLGQVWKHWTHEATRTDHPRTLHSIRYAM